MGIIGASLAFGPRNDLGVIGVGTSIVDLADELLASLFRHPAYPSLLDRAGHDEEPPEHGAGEAVTDYLALHEALDAFGDSMLDPLFGLRLDDAAIRAATLAGLPGSGPITIPRCVVIVVASAASTGTLLTFGGGLRLGEAFADAIGAVQRHPFLPAMIEERIPTLEESRRAARVTDSLFRSAPAHLELDESG